MDNVSNKQITQGDICYDYFAKQLVQKFKFNEVNLKSLKDLKNINITKSIVRYNDLLLIQMNKFEKDKELHEFQKIMLEPFLLQICKYREDIESNLNDNYIEYSLNNDMCFFIGFSQGNLCKVITFLSLSFKKLLKNDTLVACIDLICSSPVFINNKIDISSYDDLTESYKVKLGLGGILMYIVLNTFFKKVNYAILFTNPTLFKYYKKLGWTLGLPSYNLNNSYFTRQVSSLNKFKEANKRALYEQLEYAAERFKIKLDDYRLIEYLRDRKYILNVQEIDMNDDQLYAMTLSKNDLTDNLFDEFVEKLRGLKDVNEYMFNSNSRQLNKVLTQDYLKLYYHFIDN